MEFIIDICLAQIGQRLSGEYHSKLVHCVKVFVFVFCFFVHLHLPNQLQLFICTGATSGAGTAYAYGAPGFTSGFQWGSCCSIFNFLSDMQIIVCLFVIFLTVTVLSVLFRFTASDYPFDIYKLFFILNLFSKVVTVSFRNYYTGICFFFLQYFDKFRISIQGSKHIKSFLACVVFDF